MPPARHPYHLGFRVGFAAQLRLRIDDAMEKTQQSIGEGRGGGRRQRLGDNVERQAMSRSGEYRGADARSRRRTWRHHAGGGFERGEDGVAAVEGESASGAGAVRRRRGGACGIPGECRRRRPEVRWAAAGGGRRGKDT
jgi:hypothetical protein